MAQHMKTIWNELGGTEKRLLKMMLREAAQNKVVGKLAKMPGEIGHKDSVFVWIEHRFGCLCDS